MRTCLSLCDEGSHCKFGSDACPKGTVVGVELSPLGFDEHACLNVCELHEAFWLTEAFSAEAVTAGSKLHSVCMVCSSTKLEVGKALTRTGSLAVVSLALGLDCMEARTRSNVCR